jgi:glycosyltransferase involved in cell wall biosynthesis
MDNGTRFSLSIIVPVHHQGSLVEPVINEIVDFIQKNNLDYEIILVDSGGSDGSSEKCDYLVQKNPKILVIHDSVNTGFGAKLKIGYKRATKDLVWLIVLDLPFPLEKIIEAEKLFNQYDAVLSYREYDSRPFQRRLQSFVYNTLLRFVLGLKIRHINSAFRVFKREIIQSLPPLLSDGWFIDAEVLYWITRKKLNI